MMRSSISCVRHCNSHSVSQSNSSRLGVHPDLSVSLRLADIGVPGNRRLFLPHVIMARFGVTCFLHLINNPFRHATRILGAISTFLLEQNFAIIQFNAIGYVLSPTCHYGCIYSKIHRITGYRKFRIVKFAG